MRYRKQRRPTPGSPFVFTRISLFFMAKVHPKLPKVQSVAFVSLGCPKNLVDSERMLGLLAQDGISITSDASQADAIVINTCGFLEASKDESLKEIRDAIELKKSGKVKRV